MAQLDSDIAELKHFKEPLIQVGDEIAQFCITQIDRVIPDLSNMSYYRKVEFITCMLGCLDVLIDTGRLQLDSSLTELFNSLSESYHH